MLSMVVLAHFWRQDNTAVLSWVHKGKARSVAAQVSMMFYTRFQIISKVRLSLSRIPWSRNGYRGRLEQ